MDLINLPIVNVHTETHYRIKIGVDLTKKQYTDNITDLFLLDRINFLLQADISQEIKYGWFQKSNCSNNYGIILVCSNLTENVIHIYHKMRDENLKIFAYEINSVVTYLTEESRLIYKYYGFDWYCSLESFIQINVNAGNYIHDLIEKLIDDTNKIYAIGGEAGIYTKAFKKEYLCLTNSKAIYNDCLFNQQSNCELVDYNNVDLRNYIQENNGILIVNISRNGLRNLARQILNFNFNQILYIGCSDVAVKRDLDILTKRYKMETIIKINQFPKTDYYSYVIELTKN